MTPKSSLAFVFPAFINEYPTDPFGGSAELKETFIRLLRKAESQDPGISAFDFIANPFCEDELRTQFITFIFSCAAAKLLLEKKIIPVFSAGYSMGLYAALVHARSVTFEDGLLMIRKAYETIRKHGQIENYGMCSVIGLSREDHEKIIEGNRMDIHIVNQNSPYAFVFAGNLDDIDSFRDAAFAEGALNVHLLNVTIPYHSEFLAGTETAFNEFLKSIRIRKLETPIISLMDQRMLQDEEDVRNELVNNLFTPLNWYKTQLRMVELGVGRFIECGPGKSLVKNAKFIEGDYQFHDLSALNKQFKRG